ncbi:MAG TPA: type II secretion system protein [Patescibacteria group bacterium]|nr:type II secretion system protein [Patescibacteria group bacterium]
MTNQRGFTLIELSIVLAIIGLLVGGGLMSFSQVAEKNRITLTGQNMDQIESALVLFAIRNHRLPCPADGSLASTNALYGKEQAQGGVTAGTVNSCAITGGTAVVPWITLGLSENYSLDGWNHRYSYMAANAGIGTDSLVMGDSGTTAGCLYRNVTGGTQRNSTGTGTTCDGTISISLANAYPAGTYLTVQNIAGTELTTAQPTGGDAGVATTTVGAAGGRAAYVLLSHGHNGWWGYSQAGIQDAPGTAFSVAESTNGGGGATYYQDTMRTGNPSVNYFDDIVRWRTPAFIIQACGTGACGNP